MMLGEEANVKSECIDKIAAQNAELHTIISESIIKLKDDEIEARKAEAELDLAKDSIQTMLKKKEEAVQELEQKANDHDKAMDAINSEKQAAAVENA